MTRLGMIATSLAVLQLLTYAAEAEPKGHGNGKGKGKDAGHWITLNCPPGLAKKNPPCIPPGQVGKRVVIGDDDDPAWWQHSYVVGSPLPGGYVIVFDPLLYPVWTHAAYARFGDFLYLIDPVTGAILNPLGHVGDWTWDWSGVDFAKCPPGLAKKNPPCVPPGQARRADEEVPYPYQIGDHLPDGYRVIFAPPVPDTEDRALYVRIGDTMYRMDRDTGNVLGELGGVADLLQTAPGAALPARIIP